MAVIFYLRKIHTNFSSLARKAHSWLSPLTPSGMMSIFIVFSLWAMARPYTGIHHDGLLYFAQAMEKSMPQVFQDDLFFAYGSQSRFTVFPSIMAFFWSRFGLTGVNAALTLLSQAALMCASFWLLRGLSKAERWLSLIAFAILSHRYGGLDSFAFGEKFVTARILAEPLCVFALGFLLRKKLVAGFGLLLIACAIHPLLAIPAVLVSWVLLVHDDRRWLHAGWGGLAVLGLAIAGVSPFSGLLLSFDTTWFASLQHSLPCFILEWEMQDWCLCVFSSLLMYLASQSLLVSAPSVARLCKAILCLTLVLIPVSLLGCDLFHNVLITQLQVWRILWLSQYMSILLVPVLFLRLLDEKMSPESGSSDLTETKSSSNFDQKTPAELFHQQQINIVAAFSLLASAIAVSSMFKPAIVLVLWSTPWIMASSGAHDKIARSLSHGVKLTTLKWVQGLIALVVVVISVRSMVSAVEIELGGDFLKSKLSFSLICQALASTPLIAFGLIISVWCFHARAVRWQKYLMFFLAFGLAVFAALRWDQRSDWIKHIESSTATVHPFSKHMEKGDQVYWDKNLSGTWLLLRQPSFYSVSQGAGSMFNRGTGVEFARRSPHFSTIELQSGICMLMDALNGIGKSSSSACIPKIELIRDICDLRPGPRFLIFTYPLSEGLIDEWTFTQKNTKFQNTSQAVTYYLHDCRKISSAHDDS